MTGPTFLVVGGARCGTSALSEGLRAHPRVFVTEPKEPHYFALHGREVDFSGPGDERTINQVAVTDRDAYLRLYPREHDFLALGDGSVSTLYYHQHAIAEIAAVNPAMKLVALLREPVARAFSAHQYLRAQGLEPVEDVREAVACEPERIAAGWHHLWHYTAMSLYADGVEALQRAFPGQLGVFFYDDLDSDFDATTARILDFLGVPPSSTTAAEVPRVNISGRPRSAALASGLAAATANPRLRAGVKAVTSHRFRERVRRVVLAREGIDPAAHDALTPLFADDLARLRTLVDGPVPAWLEAWS